MDDYCYCVVDSTTVIVYVWDPSSFVTLLYFIVILLLGWTGLLLYCKYLLPHCTLLMQHLGCCTCLLGYLLQRLHCYWPDCCYLGVVTRFSVPPLQYCRLDTWIVHWLHCRIVQLIVHILHLYYSLQFNMWDCSAACMPCLQTAGLVVTQLIGCTC